MAEVKVNLDKRSYSIYISPNCIAQMGRRLGHLKLTDKALVVSDDTVGALYGRQILAELRQAGIAADLLCIAPGEGSKSQDAAMTIYTRAIELGMDRLSPFIALGGGVVGDVTGFAAATYMRGAPFIQVPTTLLAQVDSSVGGKVAINHPQGKNLIGAFYQPQAVFIDPEFLQTLPDRELSAGLAEVVKHGVIADSAFFTYLWEEHAAILAKDPAVLTTIIARSCQLKAEVVEQDEQDTGLRMILNFGHTIAHAVEAGLGFQHYNHGEAVAIGMHGAALLSHRLGLCRGEAVDRVRNCLQRFSLPTKVTVAGAAAGDFQRFISRDKKNFGGLSRWVLMDEIGRVQVRSDVPDNLVRQVLQDLITVGQDK